MKKTIWRDGTFKIWNDIDAHYAENDLDWLFTTPVNDNDNPDDTICDSVIFEAKLAAIQNKVSVEQDVFESISISKNRHSITLSDVDIAEIIKVRYQFNNFSADDLIKAIDLWEDYSGKKRKSNTIMGTVFLCESKKIFK